MDQTSRAVSHHAQKLRSDCAVVIAIQTIIFTSFLLSRAFETLFQIPHYYRKFLNCKSKMLCNYVINTIFILLYVVLICY
jgi:hypothetical protein